MIRLTPKEQAEVTVRHALRTPGFIYEHGPWAVQWSGWRMPVAGIAEFGAWIARQRERKGYYYVTTAGTAGITTSDYDLMTINDSQLKVFKSEQERVKAALEAFESLLLYLDRQLRPDV